MKFLSLKKSEKSTTYPLIVFWDKKNFVLRMGHVMTHFKGLEKGN